MPMMILNLTLLFVLQLAPLQFFFWHRENLFHRISEFLGRLLLGRCRHAARYAQLFQRAITRGELNKLRGVPLVFLGRRYENFRWRWISKAVFVSNCKETVKSRQQIICDGSSLTGCDCPAAFFK